jgi:hypothetical protein
MIVKLYSQAEEYTCDENNLVYLGSINSTLYSKYPPVIIIWNECGYKYYDTVPDRIYRYVQASTHYIHG